MSSHSRDACSIAVGFALALVVMTWVHGPAPIWSTAHPTTSGHTKMRGEKAFVLVVTLQFRDESDAMTLQAAWAAAADYCIAHEPFLYMYEMAQSDKDPLRYTIIERYRSKADYTGAHRHSPAFREFRPKMKALQDSGGVTVSGESYAETGIGFT